MFLSKCSGGSALSGTSFLIITADIEQNDLFLRDKESECYPITVRKADGMAAIKPAANELQGKSKRRPHCPHLDSGWRTDTIECIQPPDSSNDVLRRHPPCAEFTHELPGYGCRSFQKPAGVTNRGAGRRLARCGTRKVIARYARDSAPIPRRLI